MGLLHRAARERDCRRRVDVVVMRFRWFMIGHFIVACDLYLCLHWKMKIKCDLLLPVIFFQSKSELYIVHKVQIKISSLRWSEKKVQIKVHAWTWTLAFILRSHQITVTHLAQRSDVSLRSKLKFKFRHELWSELFLKLTQRPDLICELKIRSDLLYNSARKGMMNCARI